MPTHDIIRNSRVASSTYTDLAGNTVYKTGHGELEIGDDAAFLGHQSINVDGTLTDQPAEDEVLSRTMVCAICGEPVEGKHQLVKQRGVWVCSDCVDAPARGDY